MSDSRLTAPAIASLCELGIFHGLDTAAKRLQVNTTRIGNPSVPENRALLLRILFPKAENFRTRVSSLYVGLPEACVYRLAQRVIMFGGQPLTRAWIHEHEGERIKANLGNKYARPCEEAIAGGMLAIPEASLHPLDMRKVMKQTGVPTDKIWDALHPTRYVFSAGFRVAALRNSIAASFLFFSSAYTKEQLFKLEQLEQATPAQEYLAASIGATIATIANNPADVVKTELQRSGYNESSHAIARAIWRTEGAWGFTRGLFPRLINTAPRLAIAMTLTAELNKYSNRC